MDSEELVQYLREHLELGYPIDELKLHLVSYGVSTKSINNAVAYIQQETLDNTPSPQMPEVNSRAHVWLLMPAILFIFVFGVLMISALL